MCFQLKLPSTHSNKPLSGTPVPKLDVCLSDPWIGAVLRATFAMSPFRSLSTTSDSLLWVLRKQFSPLFSFFLFLSYLFIYLFLHIHVSILFQILFPFRLLQSTEQSSMCYTVGPSLSFLLVLLALAILCMCVCVLKYAYHKIYHFNHF